MIRKNRKFIIGGLIAVVAITVLVVGYLRTGAYSYYNISEFWAEEDLQSGQSVSVSGILQSGYEKHGLTWYFTLTDVDTPDTLEVLYSGSVPETFQAGQQITVEGRYDAETQTFRGTSIMVRCASKYEPVTT
ncbi:MAG: cytochrome c maturation protein CcmE [Dehalococcoidia bacterium]|nr:cytochrome c maturation protein CcmE [Dehalococcoidia bacterium]